MTTFRVWMTNGTYRVIDAENEQHAVKALTRGQRRHVLSVMPVIARETIERENWWATSSWSKRVH